MRLCVGCQEMKPKKELIRIVLTPEGSIEVDATGKRAGRGAYICPSSSCLSAAYKEKRLERSLKHKIESEVYASLQESLCDE